MIPLLTARGKQCHQRRSVGDQALPLDFLRFRAGERHLPADSINPSHSKHLSLLRRSCVR